MRSCEAGEGLSRPANFARGCAVLETVTDISPQIDCHLSGAVGPGKDLNQRSRSGRDGHHAGVRQRHR